MTVELPDIYDIISKVVKLEEVGKNYKGLCPFHTEKTPSFVVSPQKQSYVCFSCDEEGDVMQFISSIQFGGLPDKTPDWLLDEDEIQHRITFDRDWARGFKKNDDITIKKDRFFQMLDQMEFLLNRIVCLEVEKERQDG